MIGKHLFGNVRDTMDIGPQNPFQSSSCMLFSPTEARIKKKQKTKRNPTFLASMVAKCRHVTMV